MCLRGMEYPKLRSLISVFLQNDFLRFFKGSSQNFSKVSLRFFSQICLRFF